MVKVLFNKEDIIVAKLSALNISSAIYKSKIKWKQKYIISLRKLWKSTNTAVDNW